MTYTMDELFVVVAREGDDLLVIAGPTDSRSDAEDAIESDGEEVLSLSEYVDEVRKTAAMKIARAAGVM